jgi:hypothetical protein
LVGRIKTEEEVLSGSADIPNPSESYKDIKSVFDTQALNFTTQSRTADSFYHL